MTILRCCVASGLCMLLTGCGESQPASAPSTTARTTAPPSNDKSIPTTSEKTIAPAAEKSAIPPADEHDGVELKLGRIRLTAPKNWISKPPATDFILAEFSLPRAAGDAADGRLTVSAVGGSVDENLALWREQFNKKPAAQPDNAEQADEDADEKPPQESVEKREIAGVPVVFVDIAGTFRDQSRPSQPVVKHPGYRMLGAICDVQGQLHFIKLYGPVKTISAHADEFRALVGSLKPVE
jgi:hypothetical protein